MTIETWLTFVLTVAVAVVMSGPSVLLALGHAIRFGLSRTLGTVAGDLSANAAQILLVALGLGASLAKSPDIFTTIKWLGVAYLLFLGVRQWHRPLVYGEMVTRSADKSGSGLFIEGFLTSAANPKAILFFLALFPQFIDRNESQVPQWFILAITALIVDGIFLVIYAGFGRQLQRWLSRLDRQQWVGRITGSLLIGAAAALSTFARL
jgi:threonine/homoserine/homoserine lactone efflux protein